MHAAESPRSGALFLRLGALFAGLAVGLGAFAAHGMKAHYDATTMQTFETGARYQMYHALALLACGVLADRGHRTAAAAWCFTAGILLFSGSLYLLTWTGQRWLGAVTPFGGVAFLVGWLLLLAAGRSRTDA
jgi:uncharacterized membrane protein YgdD (TMEM256/DUF423 family)